MSARAAMSSPRGKGRCALPGAAATGAPESMDLLDGGQEAYPRMLLAISRAQRRVHLEVYRFAPTGIGARFIRALAAAAQRGVAVHVRIDGWGSARGGRTVAAALREAGCTVGIHNRLLGLFIGRFVRNHRKILLVDDVVAFLGGINIGDENVSADARVAWADLALEIRGPQCAALGRRLRREPGRSVASALRIFLCGPGGGWRLRRRYLVAFARARMRIHLAHGYFLPDRGIVRAITAAARRGVCVRLLLAGRSDIPFVGVAQRSLYRKLLSAGVHIHEWGGSVLHAKLLTVDGRKLLVGSFNLDPFSLANLETLVEVDDVRIVAQGEEWIGDHFARSRPMTLLEASSRLHRWIVDPLGQLVARSADAISRTIEGRRQQRERLTSTGTEDGHEYAFLIANHPHPDGQRLTAQPGETHMDPRIGKRYAAAYAAHYQDKDLPRALGLYTDIIEAAPEAPEAEYCRVQLHNIARNVVPKPELLAAAVELARVHLHLTAVDEPALSPGTVMAVGGAGLGAPPE